MNRHPLLGIAAALAALLPIAPVPASAQASTASAAAPSRPDVRESLVVTPAWLAARLDDPRVVVLHVTNHDRYRSGHIPGARELSYRDISATVNGLRTELPDPAALVELFERLGVSDDTRVVVYGDEPPMAARVLYTLDYIGHARGSYLDGGLEAWRAGKHPVTRAVPAVTRGRITSAARPSVVADASWIAERLGRPGIALLDTRTDGEYVGSGERHGMPSEGHLEGAHQLQWEQLFESRSHRLRPIADLRRLYEARVQPGDVVVSYCWIGYRASATYFVARLLGYEARMYDGSYQDWAQRRLPVVKGR